jgi:hypothetical protein
MANYCFYDGTISGVPKTPIATPGDVSTVVIRRGFADTTKQNLANADIGMVFPLYAGEIVLGAWYRMIVQEDTANAKVQMGVDGGSEFGGANTAVATNNTVVANFVSKHIAANGNLTLSPQNAVTLDAAKFEVGAIITKSFTASLIGS